MTSNTFKPVLATILALLTLQSTLALEVRRSDMLTQDYKDCEIYQGSGLTMLQCAQSHELYLTDKLATNWHMNIYVGDSSKPVYCTRNSLELLHPGALTYIEDFYKVKRAYIKPNSTTIEIETIMEMVGPDTEQEIPTDMWVFDQIVIVRQPGSGRFHFYEKPVVMGFPSNSLKFNETSTDYDPTILGYGWKQNSLYANEFSLYGIKDQTIVMYYFVFDANSKTMDLRGNTNTKMHTELTGSIYTSFFSRDFWIVACSDCVISGFVNFYSLQSLETVESLTMPKIAYPYQMVGYQEQGVLNRFQIFIAGGQSIDLVEYFEDPSSENRYFSLTQNLWVNPNVVDATQLPAGAPTMYIAKSENYLSFKPTLEKSMYTMATCNYYQKFNNANFTCDACPAYLRSWGMQSANCIPCGEMMMDKSGDSIKTAMYQQVCTTGQMQSWMTMVFSTFLFMFLAIVLCAVNGDGCTDCEKFVRFDFKLVPKLKKDQDMRKSIHGEPLETEMGALRASSVRGTNVSRVNRQTFGTEKDQDDDDQDTNRQIDRQGQVQQQQHQEGDNENRQSS